MLGIDAWTHAAMHGGDWLTPLRDSARTLNARSVLLSGADIGVTATTYSVDPQASSAFPRFCSKALPQGFTDVFSRADADLGQVTWTHVQIHGTPPSELGFFALSDAPLDRTAFRDTALIAASAVTTRAKLQAVRATSELKTAAFDQLAFGMVIINRQMRITESNEAFGALLARADGLNVSQEKLICREPSDQAALTTAVARALAGDLSAAILKVHRAQGAQPYVVRLVAPRGEADSRDRCLLMIVDPDEQPSAGADIWRAMFDLTECELIIAEGLVSGRRINEIANERGVSIETVRSQTKRMFERLNVSSQAEAAARLSRAAPFRLSSRSAS
jgi:DNA-binding CsgD family transcriptional regulator